MIIGIDLGETIVTRKNTTDGTSVFFPDVVRVIRRIVNLADKVHIISRVNRVQEERSKAWLQQADFFAITGIPRENLHYCREREDKAEIGRRLGVTHHIDDRPEVMVHFDDSVVKYLFRPEPLDVVSYFNKLKNTKVMSSWTEIEKEVCL
jgi:hypothetical protein